MTDKQWTDKGLQWSDSGLINAGLIPRHLLEGLETFLKNYNLRLSKKLTFLLTRCSLHILFGSEARSNKFFQNIRERLPAYTASNPGRQHSQLPQQWQPQTHNKSAFETLNEPESILWRDSIVTARVQQVTVAIPVFHCYSGHDHRHVQSAFAQEFGSSRKTFSSSRRLIGQDNRDGSVGTAAGYRLDDRGSIPGRGKRFVCTPQDADRL